MANHQQKANLDQTLPMWAAYFDTFFCSATMTALSFWVYVAKVIISFGFQAAICMFQPLIKRQSWSVKSLKMLGFSTFDSAVFFNLRRHTKRETCLQ